MVINHTSKDILFNHYFEKYKDFKFKKYRDYVTLINDIKEDLFKELLKQDKLLTQYIEEISIDNNLNDLQKDVCYFFKHHIIFEVGYQFSLFNKYSQEKLNDYIHNILIKIIQKFSNFHAIKLTDIIQEPFIETLGDSYYISNLFLNGYLYSFEHLEVIIDKVRKRVYQRTYYRKKKGINYGN